ncbi:hypothetical protein BKA61DRAFT_665513 [Leptodontidium sp. MPI-SDFR-AT-0119]|nr:hypothetical protein BKA61DRAFT_665513 [Leptodontidium sp. MPI-SDFR-AT-0119]
MPCSRWVNALHQQGVTTQPLDRFQDYVQKGGASEYLVAQLCNVDGRGSDYAIGIVASLSGDLAFVQDAVKAWNDGKCAPGFNDLGRLARHQFNVQNVNAAINSTSNTTVAIRGSADLQSFRGLLVVRAECKTAEVVANDGCIAVAARCGISQGDLTKYNTRSNFCNTLTVGEIVCCSSGTLPSTSPPPTPMVPVKHAKLNPETQFNNNPSLCSTLASGGIACCGKGTLPDIKPKPNSDGSCFVYKTKTDDDCSKIAASNGLTVTNLEDFNKNTWSWNGCKLLWVGVNMCLSTGSAPMPAPVTNADSKAGIWDQSNNSKSMPTKGLLQYLGTMWHNGKLLCHFKVGNRRTWNIGTNWCIANFGMDIVSSGKPAANIKVTYFESSATSHWESMVLLTILAIL